MTSALGFEAVADRLALRDKGFVHALRGHALGRASCARTQSTRRALGICELGSVGQVVVDGIRTAGYTMVSYVLLEGCDNCKRAGEG